MNEFCLVESVDSLSWSVVLRIVERGDARTDSRTEVGTRSRTLQYIEFYNNHRIKISLDGLSIAEYRKVNVA